MSYVLCIVVGAGLMTSCGVIQPLPRGGSAPDMPEVSIALGNEELVFDYTRDRCEDTDYPDFSARAFRDASGQVHLISTTAPHNRQMIGGSLDTVKQDCRTILRSHESPDPARFDGQEWLASFYTVDGRTVTALIHNEYQGQLHPRESGCRSGEYLKCWDNTITSAESTDGGRTFFHPWTPPDHLIASLPYRYEPDIGIPGMTSPSNIVYNPKDGHYYAMVQVEARGRQKEGACLMRTQTLNDPRSWRAWGGDGFTVQFIDPYRTAADAARHVCEPVSAENIGKSTRSLTFNVDFDKWLLVGEDYPIVVPNRTEPVWGFTWSVSDDLIHWTESKLIMETQPPDKVDAAGERRVHVSLLDPRDTSRNFEITRRRGYLYYVVWRRETPQNPGLDRDLVRRWIEFQ